MKSYEFLDEVNNMKTKVYDKSYAEVMALPKKNHKKPFQNQERNGMKKMMKRVWKKKMLKEEECKEKQKN